MTEAQRKEIQAKIEEKIAETKHDIEQLIELTKPIPPENAIGRISRMDAINNRSVNEAALRTSKSKLSKLERNLSRIDDHEFGNCTRCGAEIQHGRLLIMPESSWCIKCARRG